MTLCVAIADKITGKSRQILFEGLPPQTLNLVTERSMSLIVTAWRAPNRKTDRMRDYAGREPIVREGRRRPR